MVFAMFPIDPPRSRPVPVDGGKIKISPIKPASSKEQFEPGPSAERRKRNDRRKAPFQHRGQFEMRSGKDRRNLPHIDEEV